MSKISLLGLSLGWIFSFTSVVFPDTCSICGDSLKIVYKGINAFPLSLPGDTIEIRKVLHKNSGQITLLTNSQKIKTFAVLDTYKLREFRAEDSAYYHEYQYLADSIPGSIQGIGTFQVRILLRDIPDTCPQITKPKDSITNQIPCISPHTPFMNKDTFMVNHGLTYVSFQTNDSISKTYSDMFFSLINKQDMLLLWFDINVLAVNFYSTPKILKTVPANASHLLRSKVLSREYFSINGKKLEPSIINSHARKLGVIIVSEISSNGQISSKKIYH